MGHTTVVKNVRSTGSVKRQKESKRSNISDQYPTIVQQVLQQQVNTLAEALDNGYASGVVEQLLNDGLKFLSFRLCFLLLTDPVLQTFLYHCRMAHADGGLSCNVFWIVCIRESEIDDDGTNDSV